MNIARMIAPVTWKHDDLLEDLAGFLAGSDRMIWTDMQLGPSGSPRPDVFVLHRSYSKPRPMAFEIKISRSDLRSDTTSGKWQSYLKYAGSVVFAVPDGLCTVADIPDGCGLIVRKAATWRYVRKPTVQAVSLSMDATMKLLMDGVDRVRSARQVTARTVEGWREHKAVREKFGVAVARAAKDIHAAEEYLAHINSQAEAEVARRERAYREEIARGKAKAAEANEIRAELCKLLGVPESAHVWQLRQALDNARRNLSADERVQLVEHKLASATQSLQSALAQLEAAA